MPPLHHYAPLDKALHPSKIALAVALRELVRLLGATCDALARRLSVSPTLLSHWLSGRKVPHPANLEELWAAVQAIDADPQITWDDLLALRSHANEHHCLCCIAYHPQHQLDEPASALIPGSETLAQTFKTALPVPLSAGDRQRGTQLPDGLGTEDDLISQLRSGRHADVRLVLEEAGRKLPVIDIPVIVDALWAQEQDEAAAAVLHHAGRRKKKEVYELALLLNSQLRPDDLNLLLMSAVVVD
ncbi:helix-turn-helix domain-containing protein [Nonomuraea sp. NPDC049655]|uniref:helix-turn-helix domain-containing protein n=1 Tax=Nonomuraea sp. NPDC049655 TaxID=3364355 RepID=UPI0037B80837